MLEKAFRGGWRYRAWLGLLAALAGAGVFFYVQQLGYGLGITGMGRSVSWGLYIANMTFFVGVAASAVMVVLPYSLHNVKEFARITALGEFLAVTAVLAALTFVIVDLGQPARLFNMVLHPSPTSLLFWDMIVLSVYLALNAVIGWASLDAVRKSEPPLRWLRPLTLLSIPWAVSIHTVTAFIYSGLAARPFWLTALLAPRFLASAFASGPALLILACLIIRRLTRFDPGSEAIQKLARIVTYAMIISVFFILVEFFTVFYGGAPEHVAHFRYLLFGLDGRNALAPWAWTSLALAAAAIAVLLTPALRRKTGFLALACAAVFASVWMEKGLGLIVPGFVPAPTGEVVDYLPTMPEIFITLGVWALGALLLTMLYRIAVSVWEEAS
ncbi:MAG: polysulfide reductase NrfD [Chloroflexi bacterium]|nr:polysulfide reductase NrfD [Chloroflexota bacterium]